LVAVLFLYAVTSTYKLIFELQLAAPYPAPLGLMIDCAGPTLSAMTPNPHDELDVPFCVVVPVAVTEQCFVFHSGLLGAPNPKYKIVPFPS
jgi:hypothetical protein